MLFIRTLTAYKWLLVWVCKTPFYVAPSAFFKNQSGAVAPFAVLTLVGVLIATSFVVDTSRMIYSAAQVKRATDAAAMAIGHIELQSGNEGQLADLQKVAYGYVKNNLGMDSELIEQIEQSQIRISRSKSDDGVTYSVSVTLNAKSALLGAEEQALTIFSSVEVVSRDTEVALLIPNAKKSRSSANLSALRELSKGFLAELGVGETAGVGNGNVWFSLIPFGSSVNVYDPEDPDRIHRWTEDGALNPPELRSLFRSGKLRSLADPRAPDVVTNRLCMFRGLGRGENFFWDEPPVDQFGVYYSAGNLGIELAQPTISWMGPNPILGGEDTSIAPRVIWPQVGCPVATLLPLTKDIGKLEERFAQMRPTSASFTNIAIAMGWGGASLSPNMRGYAGLGDGELPLDFAENDNVKAMVLLFDEEDYSGESGGYNHVRGEFNASNTDVLYAFARQRFQDLCRDFRNRDIKFFMVAVFPSGVMDGVVGDETSAYVKGKFSSETIPNLRICAENGGALYAVDAVSFSAGRSQIETYLKEIAGDIRSNYYVRLIK